MTLPVDGLETPAGLTLAELAGVLSEYGAAVQGDPAVRVVGVRQDSRRIEPGELFVARAGARADGAAFIDQAIQRGARALMVEAGLTTPTVSVPVVRVVGVRPALARAAEAVYGHPSAQLRLIGVTGTNGKTTTSFLLEHALTQLGAKPARLGTLGFSFDGSNEEEGHTTPEADEVSRLLARAVRGGATHFVMEVSSHALVQDRVSALRFDVGAFTNLTQDHLDFHGSMAEYGAAKARLFAELTPRASVINSDDEFGAQLARTARGAVTVSCRAAASVSSAGVSFDADGIHGEVVLRGRRCAIESRLVGAHNWDNLLLCLGVLDALGFAPEESVRALQGAPAPPGRLERCDVEGDELVVVVDYAHTPDALERVLAALRPITRGRLICVFGCGGDRDPTKRPLMGEAVAAGADLAIVTNDNPRTEDPERIAQAIVPSIEQRGTPFRVELDRARAIESAIFGALASDTVLIAGKGHETYQIFGSQKHHFDDREQARRALALRRGRAQRSATSEGHS